MNAPNSEQIQSLVRWLLAAGGPIGAMIIQKTGGDATTLNQITAIALYVVPPAVSLVWSMVAKRQDRQVAQVSQSIPGVTVVVDAATAPKSVVDAAKSSAPQNANVVLAEPAKQGG